MSTAVIKVQDPACWLCDVSFKFHLAASLVARQALDSRRTRDAADVLTRPSDREGIVMEIQRHPSVDRACFSDSGPNRLLGIVDVRGCSACPAADDAGVVILKTVTDGEGKLEWLVAAPRPGQLRNLLVMLRVNGCEARVTTSCPPSAPNGMTARQQEVLRAALSGGYFEEPKRLTLAQLAQRLRISESVAGRILRKALRHSLLP